MKWIIGFVLFACVEWVAAKTFIERPAPQPEHGTLCPTHSHNWNNIQVYVGDAKCVCSMNPDAGLHPPGEGVAFGDSTSGGEVRVTAGRDCAAIAPVTVK